jgi:hypothetical protein
MTKRLLIILAILLAACGGTATTTTGSDDPDPTTETTEAESEGEGETVDLSDMPQECIDAFVTFLQAIEPVVEGFDFETATLEDMGTIATEIEAVTEAPTAAMENLDCPDVDSTDEEAFAAMIEIAENEAPGTVGYFRWIEDFASSDFGGGTGGGVTGSGDCETDIEALEAFIEENETMGALTVTELGEYGGLVTAITNECSLERTSEFFAQPEIQAFASGG